MLSYIFTTDITIFDLVFAGTLMTLVVLFMHVITRIISQMRRIKCRLIK